MSEPKSPAYEELEDYLEGAERVVLVVGAAAPGLLRSIFKERNLASRFVSSREFAPTAIANVKRETGANYWSSLRIALRIPDQVSVLVLEDFDQFVGDQVPILKAMIHNEADADETAGFHYIWATLQPGHQPCYELARCDMRVVELSDAV